MRPADDPDRAGWARRGVDERPRIATDDERAASGQDAGVAALGSHQQVPELRRDGHTAVAAKRQEPERCRRVQGGLLARFGRGHLPQVAAGDPTGDDRGDADGPRARHGLDVDARADHEDGTGSSDIDARRLDLRVGPVRRR